MGWCVQDGQAPYISQKGTAVLVGFALPRTPLSYRRLMTDPPPPPPPPGPVPRFLCVSLLQKTRPFALERLDPTGRDFSFGQRC